MNAGTGTPEEVGSVTRTLTTLLVVLGILCGIAHAEVTVEIICQGMATAICADGTVVVGNTQGDYETFRWTEEGGRERLGRGTVAVLGGGAGAPDISDDCTMISATILGSDSTYGTQGRWVENVGWEECMPPTPPDGGLMSDFYGSAWGISGDGGTLVGLYWRPGQPGGSAHASAWTESTGVVDLGSDGRDSRANDADYDGSVIVGWDSNPEWGGWRPAVWVDGVKTILAEYDAFCQADAVNADGTVIGGQSYDDSTNQRGAALWRWSGSAWVEDYLGVLPGTFAGYGVATVRDMTPDASVVVGYNAFDYGVSTGFIWTEETGMVDVEDFLTDNGASLPTQFLLLDITGVSADGKTMVGIGQDTYYPWNLRSFMIRIEDSSGVPVATATTPAPSMLRVLSNPARGATTLMLNVPESSRASLEVYDITGRLVRQVLDGTVLAGEHEVQWDGKDTSGRKVAPGAYIIRLSAGDRSETKKVIQVR
jgi:uncharacterized membrane protein